MLGKKQCRSSRNCRVWYRFSDQHHPNTAQCCYLVCPDYALLQQDKSVFCYILMSLALLAYPILQPFGVVGPMGNISDC